MHLRIETWNRQSTLLSLSKSYGQAHCSVGRWFPSPTKHPDKVGSTEAYNPRGRIELITIQQLQVMKFVFNVHTWSKGGDMLGKPAEYQAENLNRTGLSIAIVK